MLASKMDSGRQMSVATEGSVASPPFKTCVLLFSFIDDIVRNAILLELLNRHQVFHCTKTFFSLKH